MSLMTLIFPNPNCIITAENEATRSPERIILFLGITND